MCWDGICLFALQLCKLCTSLLITASFPLLLCQTLVSSPCLNLYFLSLLLCLFFFVFHFSLCLFPVCVFLFALPGKRVLPSLSSSFVSSSSSSGFPCYLCSNMTRGRWTCFMCILPWPPPPFSSFSHWFVCALLLRLVPRWQACRRAPLSPVRVSLNWLRWKVLKLLVATVPGKMSSWSTGATNMRLTSPYESRHRGKTPCRRFFHP